MFIVKGEHLCFNRSDLGRVSFSSSFETYSKTNTKTFVVLHKSNNFRSLDDVIRSSAAGYRSFHLMIDREGFLHQMMSFDKCANHCGPSVYYYQGKRYQRIDHHSIGILLENYGKIDENWKFEGGRYHKPNDSIQVSISSNEVTTLYPSNERWHQYSPGQYQALQAVLAALNIKPVLTHDQVSKKGIDLGPIFDYRKIDIFDR